MAQNRTSNINRFWKIYKIVLCIALAVLLIGLCILWGHLKKVEQSQPKYLAAQFFKDVTTSSDISKTLRSYDIKISDLETSSSLQKSNKSAFSGGKLTYNTVAGSISDGVKYVIKSNGTKEASFVLTPGSKSKYKVTAYTIGSSDGSAISISAPSGSDIYVNGKKLSSSYISKTNVTPDAAKHLPSGITVPKYTNYKVSGLIAPAAVTVKKNGEKLSLQTNADKTKYTASLTNNTKLQKKYSDYVLKAGEMYAAYMQHDASLGQVANISRAAQIFTRALHRPKRSLSHLIPDTLSAMKNRTVSMPMTAILFHAE